MGVEGAPLSLMLEQQAVAPPGPGAAAPERALGQPCPAQRHEPHGAAGHLPSLPEVDQGDVPQNESYSWPAWEILKKTVDASPQAITGEVKVSVAEEGPLRASVCVERTLGDSRFRQWITLREGAQADRIDLVNDIDWQSSNALLKAEFPLSVSNPEAVYDLGVGSVARGNNTATAYEVYAQQWADLTDADGSYGVSVLNDSKYGWDKPADNTLLLGRDDQFLGVDRLPEHFFGNTGGRIDASPP